MSDAPPTTVEDSSGNVFRDLDLPCDWVIWMLDREFVGAGNKARCRTCGAYKPEDCRG